MKNELIPLLADLGIITAVWLHHTSGKKVLTVMHKGYYVNWAYLNNELKGFSVVLNSDGSIGGKFNGNIRKWEYYLPATSS